MNGARNQRATSDNAWFGLVVGGMAGNRSKNGIAHRSMRFRFPSTWRCLGWKLLLWCNLIPLSLRLVLIPFSVRIVDNRHGDAFVVRDSMNTAASSFSTTKCKNHETTADHQIALPCTVYASHLAGWRHCVELTNNSLLKFATLIF
jgi:hypothetical protein